MGVGNVVFGGEFAGAVEVARTDRRKDVAGFARLHRLGEIVGDGARSEDAPAHGAGMGKQGCGHGAWFDTRDLPASRRSGGDVGALVYSKACPSPR